MKYTPPEFELTAFTCPICGVLSQMVWTQLEYINPGPGLRGYIASPVYLALCMHCKAKSIWLQHVKAMIWPSDGSGAPLPHEDLPDDVKPDYLEARSIVSKSPRGAAALLRLAVQKLCVSLGEQGKNINDDIASLVRKGLPSTIQQALDIVRVTGNNAVHPGELKVGDDPSTATTLFTLLNIIVENRIAEPKRIAALYDALPSGAKDAVAKRDSP